jgi:hypothetical protein
VDQFGQFVQTRLRDVVLVDDQEDLYSLVKEEQPLQEEGVGDLELISAVVSETRAVEEVQLPHYHLGGHGGLRELVVPNFEGGGVICGVEDGVEAVVLDHQLVP